MHLDFKITSEFSQEHPSIIRLIIKKILLLFGQQDPPSKQWKEDFFYFLSKKSALLGDKQTELLPERLIFKIAPFVFLKFRYVFWTC